MGIKENIARLEAEILSECERIGRGRDEIVIVSASKYADADGIKQAYDTGLRDFGENRIQDALQKIEILPKDIVWHFIGHLQSNKVNKAVGVFDIIHSVDSHELAMKIDEVAKKMCIVQKIMLEVNMSGEESKFGLPPELVESFAEKIIGLKNIELLGLMTMAPLTDDEKILRSVFRGLRELRDSVNSKNNTRLRFLSMGMTNDWRIALEEGATHLRIGSAIFMG